MLMQQLDKQEIIDEAMDFLDFERIHKVMNALNWTWRGSDEPPEIYELRRELRKMLNQFIDENLLSISCGGFSINKIGNNIKVSFELTEVTIEREK